MQIKSPLQLINSRSLLTNKNLTLCIKITINHNHKGKSYAIDPPLYTHLTKRRKICNLFYIDTLSKILFKANIFIKWVCEKTSEQNIMKCKKLREEEFVC